MFVVITVLTCANVLATPIVDVNPPVPVKLRTVPPGILRHVVLAVVCAKSIAPVPNAHVRVIALSEAVNEPTVNVKLFNVMLESLLAVPFHAYALVRPND